jgi:thioredoxin 2
MTATNVPDADRVMMLRCPACSAWNRVRGSRAADGPKCGQCSAALEVDHPFALTDETFERTVRESTVPVLVDFYADWCGPCKQMAPAVDALASKYRGAALVAKLDTDRAQRTAGQFRITGIPTTIVFSGGAEVARQTGAVPLPALERLLASGGVGAR